jgi:hypothetical protein
VRQDRGSGGVKRRVVVGVVEVPVSVDDAFHWRVAQTIESLFEPGPGRRNESVHDEFAVWTVEDYNASPGAGEHCDVFGKPLCFQGSGVELCAHIREQVGRRRRLLRVQRRVKEVRQKGAAGQGN